MVARSCLARVSRVERRPVMAWMPEWERVFRSVWRVVSRVWRRVEKLLRVGGER